jgi:acyl carrier protein
MTELENIISKVLGLKLEEINDNLSRNDVESWDSFNHLLLISEIEKELGISFSLTEIEEIQTVKNIKEVISK